LLLVDQSGISRAISDLEEIIAEALERRRTKVNETERETGRRHTSPSVQDRQPGHRPAALPPVLPTRQAVHALLANRTRPWLLIIDNIATPETLKGLLPAAGTGDVLVTSRAGTWPERAMVLAVQPLTRSDAVRLVTSLSGDPDDHSAAVLAHELGGLPLALAQAGCYVAHSALDLAGYLSLYRSRRAELHQQGHALECFRFY
jgi:hypothetical protein